MRSDAADGAIRPLPAARLYAVLARDAPAGIVFRRGPSRWVQLLKWDLKTDTLEPGQWFHGRIYEQEADLSPDGRLLVYYAAKFQKGRRGPAHTGWTALSKPPWLTALRLWPQGVCFLGGGLFVSNEVLWRNHFPGPDLPEQGEPLNGIRVIPKRSPDTSLKLERLRRRGWMLCRHAAALPDGTVAPAILERTAPSSGASIVLHLNPYGRPAVLARPSPDTEPIALPGATWADWDYRNRLLYAAQGKLLAAEVTRDGEIRSRELADLNASRPEAREAPDWAKRW